MTNSTKILAEKYPLQWPSGYPRTMYPKRARFGDKSFAFARDRVYAELRLLLNYQEIGTAVLSTNIPLRLDGIPYANYRQPDDKGVAVYFLFKGDPVVLCCDQWDKIEHNLWAISETISAIRSIERWGVSDFLKRSFTGFQALPPKQDAEKWWQVLSYESIPGKNAWDWAGVQSQYKSLAKKYHPDTGGSVEQFQILAKAYEEAKSYFGQ